MSACMSGTRDSGVLSSTCDVIVRGVDGVLTCVFVWLGAVYTSIVSRHPATRGNNKILHRPTHISSSEERLPRLTRRTLAQLRTNKSPFLKSYLHEVDAKTHPSPLCPLCNINTHDTHHLFNCTHIRTTLSPLDLWTDPAGVIALLARWTEKLAGGPQAGTSDSPH